MTPEIVTGLIIAIGGGSLIPKAIDVIHALISGRAREEKEENQSLLTRTVKAEAYGDREADFRRRIEEWASGLVYMLKQIGVPDTQIPAKPERKERITT